MHVCNVGHEQMARIEILRDTKVADSYIYYTHFAGEIRPFFGDVEHSRGSDVRIECAGKAPRALVTSGEFTANAAQGFVLTYNTDFGMVERLDFAEKERPKLLYLGRQETLVVIPTFGHGETNKKYTVYSKKSGSNEHVVIEGVNDLPWPGGSEVVRFGKPRKARKMQIHSNGR